MITTPNSDKELFAHLFVDLNGAQKYQDVDQDELLVSCKYFQRKYDGNWGAAISHSDGTVGIYSKTGKLKNTVTYDLFPKQTILIGEYLVGTQWSLKHDHGSFYAFDCLLFNGSQTSKEPWIRRQATANFVAKVASGMFKPTEVFTPETVSPLLIDKDFEGIVGRRENETWFDKVSRFKHEFTADVKILNVLEGQGRLKGTMGALTVLYDSGAEGEVGGGFSDEQRLWFWSNKEKALGLTIEIAGKAVFDSGLLRHPNFKKVRKDK